MRIEVWDLLLDDANIEKMHEHGVSVGRVYQVLDGEPRVIRNHGRGGAPFLLVGLDASGRFLTVPIDPTADHGVWRPRTAYPSKPADVTRYRRLRS